MVFLLSMKTYTRSIELQILQITLAYVLYCLSAIELQLQKEE